MTEKDKDCISGCLAVILAVPLQLVAFAFKVWFAVQILKWMEVI